MDWNFITSYLPRYKDALFLTLKIGWLGIALAFLVGIICTIIIYLKIPVIRKIVGIYI